MPEPSTPSSTSWICSTVSGFSEANNSASMILIASCNSISGWGGYDPVLTPDNRDRAEQGLLARRDFFQAHELEQRQKRRNDLQSRVTGGEDLLELERCALKEQVQQLVHLLLDGHLVAHNLIELLCRDGGKHRRERGEQIEQGCFEVGRFVRRRRLGQAVRRWR